MAVKVKVQVGVLVGVKVGETVFVKVKVKVLVGVKVLVHVNVGVGVLVGEKVGVLVRVGVMVQQRIFRPTVGAALVPLVQYAVALLFRTAQLSFASFTFQL